MTLTEARRVLGLGRKRSVDSALACFAGRVQEVGSRLTSGSDEHRAAALRDWADLVEALGLAVGAAASAAKGAEITPIDDGDDGGSKGPATDHGSLRWPDSLGESAAHALLGKWAASKHGVPDDLFAGPLSVSDGSVPRYTLRWVVETRREERETVAGPGPPRIQNSYAAELGAVAIPHPAKVRGHTWDFVKEGSVVTRACGDCDGGQQRCTECGGRGTVGCERLQRCDICGGSGEVHEGLYDSTSPMERCGECHGRGEMTCRVCGGSGTVDCPRCGRRGYVDCPTCDATGWRTSFVHGIVEQTVESASVGGVGSTSPIKKKSKKARSLESVLPGSGIPSGVPPADVPRVQALLAARDGEMVRELVADVMPVTIVEYSHGGTTERAFVVGTDQAIVAPAAAARRRRRLLYWVVAAAAVVGLAVALLVALGAFGSDPTETESDGAEPSISGAEIEQQFRDSTTAVSGSGARPETTSCPDRDFYDGEMARCSFALSDGRTVELLITLEQDGADWVLHADAGQIG